MPGIVGIIDGGQPLAATAALIRAMVARLRPHPGLRVEIDRNPAAPAILGRVDLGVLDPGRAPVVSADGTCRLVLHGEIAGRPGGAAALLADYVARGPAALARLSGSFAAALWDARLRRLFVLNDRFGLRNVYYTARGGRLLFAPEAAALLADPRVPRRLDPQAAAEFACLQFVCGDRTLLDEIQLLPPASLLVFEPGGTPRLETTWRLVYRPRARDVAAHGRAVADALSDAAARHVGGVRIALPLSGGLDSRTLLAAVPASVRPLATVTYGRATSDDRRLAAELAAAAGTMHHVIPLAPGYIGRAAADLVARTDGMHSCLNAHAVLLRRAARIADVLLLGNGGDCLLDGLWDGPDVADDASIAARLFDKLAIGLPPALAAELVAPGAPFADLVPRARAGLTAALAAVDGDLAADRADAFNVVQRHRRWVLLGVAAQATHVEYRHPYYDDAVVEAALAVPPDLRAGRRAHVAALRRLSPTLAAVRRQGKAFAFDAGHWRLDVDRVRLRLGGAIRWRANRIGFARLVDRPDRRAFTDCNAELRRGSRALLERVLLGAPTLARGWWRPERLRALVREHLSGARNHAPALGVVVTLELFARAVLDDQEQTRFGLDALDHVHARDACG